MEISMLRRLASAWYETETIAIPELLTQWNRESPGEVESILANSGMTREGFEESICPFLLHNMSIDRRIMEKAIVESFGKAVEAHDLLACVLDCETHYLTKKWRKSKVDIEILRENILDQCVDREVQQHQRRSAENELDEFGRNLTRMAKKGAFNNLLPEKDTLETIMNILQRKEKGNMILTGPAGVGKTSMVQVLAKELLSGGTAEQTGYTVYEISMRRIISGTRYRGEFEEKFGRVIEAAACLKPVILFVDEIHTIMGAGRTDGGSQDMANLLKPLLSQGDIRMIGATTTDEYQEYIKKDPALDRRFQEVPMKEPKGEGLVRIVRTHADSLTRFHGVEIPDRIISYAIGKTEQFLKSRYQPDKTHDLLDSACVYAKNKHLGSLTTATLDSVLSRFSKIPEWVIANRPSQSAGKLGDELKSRVYGQDRVIDQVCELLTARYHGLGEKDKPLAVFLFAGSTGVGKTQLAKEIALATTGSCDNLLQIDLSNYRDHTSINTLIGSPPGYAGCDKEGLLTGAIASKPFTVLLLDEIEKATPEIHNMLLSMLDTGKIRDARGKTVDATSVLIMMTTNAVTHQGSQSRGIGFHMETAEAASALSVQKLGERFSKEFLARIDRILVFDELKEADYRKIIAARLRATIKRAFQSGVRVRYNESTLTDRILEAFYRQPVHQVRMLHQIIERYVQLPIAQELSTCGQDTDIRDVCI